MHFFRLKFPVQIFSYVKEQKYLKLSSKSAKRSSKRCLLLHSDRMQARYDVVEFKLPLCLHKAPKENFYSELQSDAANAKG